MQINFEGQLKFGAIETHGTVRHVLVQQPINLQRVQALVKDAVVVARIVRNAVETVECVYKDVQVICAVHEVINYHAAIDGTVCIVEFQYPALQRPAAYYDRVAIFHRPHQLFGDGFTCSVKYPLIIIRKPDILLTK